jgi:hypothetical protein
VGSAVVTQTEEGGGHGDGVSTTNGRDQGEAGPGGSGRGARAMRERNMVLMGCRLVGPDGIVPGGTVQTRFEIKSEFNCFKQFQTVSNFGRLEKYLPRLGKIEIKYSFEDLREMNNFLYRNFLRFRMDLE